MFLNTEKEYIENTTDEQQSITDEYMDKINKSFFDMLKNPTDKNIKAFKDTRDALIVGWLGALYALKTDYYNAAQQGIDVADEQLKAKNITKKAKQIDKNVYTNKIDATYDSFKTDIETIGQSIKANSDKVINEIKKKSVTGIISEQKKISTQLVADLQDKGITFFTDKIGRKFKISDYIRMRVLTDTVSLQRDMYFTRAVEYGVDLVRIRHLNIHPTCELCKPFNNKVLSINGDTEGYMTIDEASSYGLFHPNCDHVPEELELEPTDNGGEGNIKLNKANQKRFEYNSKKTML